MIEIWRDTNTYDPAFGLVAMAEYRCDSCGHQWFEPLELTAKRVAAGNGGCVWCDPRWTVTWRSPETVCGNG